MAGRARSLLRLGLLSPHRQESSMLDVLYIVIGVIAFAITVRYLPACDRL